MSSLLILGAADGAVPTYQRASKMGYRTVCVDINAGAPGVPYADEFLHLSTRAPELVATALAGRHDIVGVLAPASDIALPAQRQLAIHFGLPDPVSPAAVAASADKWEFRQVCDRLGFPSYRTVAGSPGDDLVRAARGLRFPVLVKPVDSTGSRGVVPCGVPGALPAAIRDAVAFSPANRLVVEEFVDGTHLTVEALVRAGRPVFHTVSARTLTPPPYFITATQTVPADLPDDVEERLAGMLATLVAELGYASGPLNLDAVLGRDGELYLVEMGARSGGNGMAELVDASYGVDLLAATVSLAVGDPVTVVPRTPRPVMLWVLAADRPGRLAAIHGLAEVRAMPEVLDVRLFAAPGDQVKPYDQAANKVGYVILAADTRAALRTAATAVAKNLSVELMAP